MTGFLSSFWLALSFLTVLPARQVEFRLGALGRAGVWFPLIGLVMGGLLLGVSWMAQHFFAPLVAGALTVAVWAALSGGLHLDGFADCCDGLLASASRDRRLEIMHDPRTGAFAVVGVTLLLILKVATLASLASSLPVMLLAPTWARWMILLIARQKPVHSGGMGGGFAAGLTPSILIAALVAPIALSFFFLSWRVVLAVLLVHIVGWLTAWMAHRRLGGVTGDVYGMVVELSELTVLLVFAGQSW